MQGCVSCIQPGAQIGYAVALSHLHGPDAGIAVLDALPKTQVAGLQSYHATRAHFLAEQGELNDAAKCYETALALTFQPALRVFLQEKQSAIVAQL
jgi:predicted RNA polymerase sigma factor